MSATTEDLLTLDLLTHSRKLTLQRNLSLENNLGVRLSWVRWLWIIGLFAFDLLDKTLIGRPLALNSPSSYLIGVYALLNLIVMGVSFGFGQKLKLLVPITLVLDIIITSAISLLLEPPIFFFAYIPGFLAMLLIGLGEGIFSVLLVAGLNVYYLFSRSIKFDGEVAIQFYGLVITLVMIALSLLILVQTGAPLLRISNAMLEEALAKANEGHLAEMQNRAKALYRVANTLSSTLDYQKVVRAILHELESIFDVSAGVVLRFEGTLNNMVVADALRLTPEEEKRNISANIEPFKSILMGGQPVVINDAQQYGEIYKTFPSLKSCRSLLITPLRAGFEVFGLLMIGSKQENAYASSDIELMVTLTAHAVIAMQNATLYRNLLEDRNKLLSSEEELRHQLARDLHDGPAQAVAAFSMQTEFIRRLFKSEPDRALEELSALGKQAQQTAREIRTLLYELRPLVLEAQGLEAALEQYAKRFPITQNDPYVHYSSPNFDLRLAPQVETTIFTILQEAVNNARKHAQARNIWLYLGVKDGYIIASAQDDGKGFDLKKIEADYASRGSLGLTNMKERAGFVGGQVRMQSAPGQGTVVVVQIPINDNTMPDMNGNGNRPN